MPTRSRISHQRCDDPVLNPGPLTPAVELSADPASRALRRAAVLEVSARGYREVAVRDLLTRTGLARTTFYARYPSKQACVVATLEEAAASALSRAERLAIAGRDAREPLRAVVGVLLDTAAQHPEATRMLLLDSHAAGPAAAAARDRAVAAYAELIATALAPAARSPLVDDVSRAIAGGLERIALARIAEGRADELPAHADELTRWAASYRKLLPDAQALIAPPTGVRPLRRRGRAPGSLVPVGPGGRRRLAPGPRPGPRSIVEHSQRDRILDAVATIVAEEGYDALTTRSLAEHAEISMRTIYERFESVDHAFAATLLTGARGAMAAALPESLARPDPAEGLVAGLAALTTFLAEEPAFAKVALVDALAAGPLGLEAQLQAHRTLAAFLVQGVDGAAIDVPRDLIAEAVAGGAWELCAHQIRSGETTSLPAVAPTLAFLALAPLHGPRRTLSALSEAGPEPPALRPPR